MYCIANGACYNYDPKDAMCPSWKVTRERKHRPKGRASPVRQWLFLLQQHEKGLQKKSQRTLGLVGGNRATRIDIRDRSKIIWWQV